MLPVTPTRYNKLSSLASGLNSLSGSVLPVTRFHGGGDSVCERVVSIPFRVRCCRSRNYRQNHQFEQKQSQFPFGFGAAGHIRSPSETRRLAARSQFPFGFGAAGHAIEFFPMRPVTGPSLNSLSGSVLPVTLDAEAEFIAVEQRSQFPFGFGAAGHATKAAKAFGFKSGLNSLSGSVLPVTGYAGWSMSRRAVSQFPFGFGAAGHP